MSTEKKYICDFCGATTLLLDSWIEITSDGGTVSISNNFPRRNSKAMNNFQSIHFCSADCLLNKFVKKHGYSRGES